MLTLCVEPGFVKSGHILGYLCMHNYMCSYIYVAPIDVIKLYYMRTYILYGLC